MRSSTNKLFAALGIMLMLQWQGVAGTRCVCKDGTCDDAVCNGTDYTSIYSAVDASSATDSIIICEGPALYAETSTPNLKRRAVLLSRSPQRDTLQRPNNVDYVIRSFGDSTEIHNLVIRFRPDTTWSSYGYLYRTTGYGGHRFNNVKFTWGGTGNRSEYKYGPSLDRNAGTATEKTRFTKCTFDTLAGAFGIGTTTATLNDSVEFDSCIFGQSGVLLAGWSKLQNSIVRIHAGEEIVADSGHDILIDNVLFNSRLSGGAARSDEVLTWDENNSKKSYNDTVRNCVWDSTKHVSLAADAIWNSVFQKNKFISRAATDASALYNHNNNVAAGDTQANHLSITNVTWCGLTRETPLNWVTASDTSNDVDLRNSLLIGNRTISMSNIWNDTVCSLVTTNAATLSGTVSSVSDTMKGRGTAFLLDTVQHTYHKHSSPYPWAGSNKYLSNWKQLAYDVQTTGFSVACSLASDFRHDNNFYADSFWVHNTWWCKDSAKTYLYVDSDTSTWNAPVDSTALVPGGTTDVLTATGLSASTKYYYRMITNTTALTGSLKDTTLTKDTTTAGGAANPVIDSVADTTQRIKRLQIVKMYVTDLPDSSATTHVHFNALDLAKPGRWSGGQVWDTIPADAPRGRYMPRLFDGADTLAVSPDSVRVFVPALGKDGSN